MALQFRRGTAAEVVSQSFVPEIGEPIYITDEQQLYIGDGTTQKGNPVGGSGSSTLESLTDVKLSTERTNTIVSYSITSNVATINLITSHGFWYYTGLSVTISNSSVSILNGTHVITAYTSQSVSFALTSPDVAITVADGDTHVEIGTGDILVYDGINNEFVNFDYSAFFQNPLFSNPHTLSYNLNTNTYDIVSPSSTDVTIAPSTAKAAIKGNSTTAGQLALNCEQNSHAVILKGAPHSAAANYTLTMPSSLPSVAGQALVSDTSGQLSFSTVSGGGVGSRTTNQVTTASIADGASDNVVVTGAKTYVLMSIETNYAAWVTVYTSAAARTADASRTINTDPLPGSGVIAEVINSTGVSQDFTPGVIGYSDELPASTDIYLKVENRSGSTRPIIVTVKFLALEV